jgi:hypothetical protein
MTPVISITVRQDRLSNIQPSGPARRRECNIVSRHIQADPVQEALADAAAPARSVVANHQRGGDGGINRRAFPRAAGPFDGRRVGALETPIKIFDLSAGGCFINSMHEQQPGVTMVLRIELPDQPSITVTAQSLYSRAEFGFAVLFMNVNPSTQAKLEQAVQTARSTPQ